MKKIISLFVLLLFLTTNSCHAFSELYYFKNIKTSSVEPLVNMGLSSQDFTVIKENPYYAVSADGKDRAIIILQQSGENMFYYYNADKNTRINKAILKEIKRQNIVCEQSFNQNIISIYDGLAQTLEANSGEGKKYTFEEEEQVVVLPKAQPEYKQHALTGYIAQIPAGTQIPAYLQNSINTANASKGDEVIAVTSSEITLDGNVIIPQGSLIYGTLTTARNATYGSRNGRVVITFNKIITPDNQTYNISAETIDFTVSNDGKISSAASSVLVKAAAGAAIGLLFALLADKSAAKSAAIGAGVGAGSALVYSAAEKGVDAEIPSFTEIELTLTKPLSVSISK